MDKYELREYRDLVEEEDIYKKKVDELRSTMESIKAQQITGMPKGNSVDDMMTENLILLEEAELKYAIALNKVLKASHRILSAIESLKDAKERLVIEFRYIEGYTWPKIAEKIKYSEAQTHRIHASALQNLRHF